MASPAASQQAAPFLPGAWPNLSQENLDPDASTASYPVVTDSRDADFSSERAQRRWTYAGPDKPPTAAFSPATPTSPNFVPMSASASQGSRMSGLTDNTVSSAASSALNTPEMARWTTLPSAGNGNQPRAAFDSSEVTPGSPDPFTESSRTHSPRYEAGAPLTKQSSSPLVRDRYGSPSLDAPLLSIVPGLPPLKFPLPEYLSQRTRYDSLPAPPSPLSESCSPPASFYIPTPREELPPSSSRTPAISSPSGIATDFFPVVEETPEPSPQLTIPSLPSSAYVSDADSFVLPLSESDNTPNLGSARPAFVDGSPSASQMDAFALAAAVAASPSRSSLSIPASFQSITGTPTIPDTQSISTSSVARPYAHRQPSCLTQASTGHWGGTVRSVMFEVDGEEDPDVSRSPSADRMDRARMRRRSAPLPTAWHSPRPAAPKTTVSRVDVGSSRRVRSAKQPVLGKVRRFGERIRGLFKSKGGSPVKAKTGVFSPVQPAPEYGLMTTTTAVTSVEYESEHPIPAPSPRAKMLRNHRRSLPLPSLMLPSSAENLASAIFKRPSASRSNSSQPAQDPFESAEDGPSREDPSSYTPTQSPRTPRAQRPRTVTADQAEEVQTVAQGGQKARRFSLSSALSRSRLDTLRSTMVPRPPLPPVPSHSFYDNNLPPPSLRTAPSQHTSGTLSASDNGSGYWGEELPSVQITRDSQDCSFEDSPRRMRTQTAPPAPPAEPDTVPTTPKAKRPRRFSLSSMIARRASRTRVAMAGVGERPPMPTSSHIPPIPTRSVTEQNARRPRGDTITTITQGVPFDMVQPPLDLQVDSSTPRIPADSRFSMTSTISSSHAGSAYFDACEHLSEDNYHSSFDADRSCSPGPESDLDSMSFARTPDYCSGTFSFRSSGDRPRYVDTDELSIPGSYNFRPSLVGRCASTSAVSQLVGGSARTPLVKTLRFSPSLSLSFDRTWSDDGEDDELGMMEQEEDRGFMRALGFEFDEIARRVREEPI